MERVYPYLKAFEGCILLDVFDNHNMVGAGVLDSPFFHKIRGVSMPSKLGGRPLPKKNTQMGLSNMSIEVFEDC